MKRKIIACLVALTVLLTCTGTVFAKEAGTPDITPTVVAARDSSFYLDAQGRLWAWGCNLCGQLGDGSQTNRSVPVKILDNVVQVSSSGLHTLAVTADGALWGWGLCLSNLLMGAKGNATCWESPVQTTPIKLMDGVSQAAAGPWCTLVLKADGSLWTTTGVIMDQNGALQDGKPGLVHLLDGAVDCDAGYDSASAILPDGTFYAWSPVRFAEPDQAGRYLKPALMERSRITQSSYGLGQVISVTTDGSLEYFGANDRGQGAGESNFEYNGLPYRIGAISLEAKAVQAASGSGFSAAVDENGGLWLWGRNDRGQLGTGGTKDALQPVKALEGAAQVSCGDNHTVVLKTDGTVWCWGDGEQGQIGMNRFGTKDYFSPIPIPMALAAPGETRQVTLNTGYTLQVDGEARDHWSYALPKSEGDTWLIPFYSTLRSVAALLNGTPAQFDVVWDGAAKSVRVTTGVPYRGTGRELVPPADGTYTAVPATSTLYIDGRETALSGYLINGNHAYTINDLCAALGVEVRLGTAEGGGLELRTAPLSYGKALADARTVEPEEVLPLKTVFTKDGPNAVWNAAGDKVLVATWNDTPKTYPDGKTVKVGKDAVWVFSGAECSDWYAANSAGVSDWDLRMAQVLGMPEDAGCTSVTTLWVSPADLFRPAFNPDITTGTTGTMATALTGSKWYQDWFKANTAASYGENGRPWTRLGYTYDWADNGTEYGFTEFIIRPGAQVTVGRTLATEDYLKSLTRG